MHHHHVRVKIFSFKLEELFCKLLTLGKSQRIKFGVCHVSRLILLHSSLVFEEVVLLCGLLLSLQPTLT